MDMKLQVERLTEQFSKSKKLMIAIGNETRQTIITALIDPECNGMRVGDIKEKIYLSRPAVSHHLKILLDEEVIGVNRVGTKNYYYLKLGGEWQSIVALVNNIEKLRTLKGEENE